MWWDWRLGNSLNADDIWHLTGPKWFEPSDWHFHPQKPRVLSVEHHKNNIKKNIQFTSWLDIEGKILNNQMIKRLVPIPQCGHDHWKLPYFNGFTASNLCPPPYCHLYSIENTHISGLHFQQRPLGGAAQLFSTPPHPPTPQLLSVTFSELSSKCHSVCYKSRISSLCLQVVAFCAKARQPVGSVLPPRPRPPSHRPWKKKKKTNIVVESLLLLGASWLLPPLRLTHHTSCIHPFIHPFNIHPSDDDDSGDQDWNHQSGLLEEVMVLRRAVVLCRRCSGWILLTRLRRLASYYVLNWSRLGGRRSGLRRLPTSSCFTHRRTHQFQAQTLDAGTDVAVWASWKQTHTQTHSWMSCLAVEKNSRLNCWFPHRSVVTLPTVNSVDNEIRLKYWCYEIGEWFFFLH